MKHLNFFKRALLALLILCSSSTWAHDFVVDGIYYNITDATNKTVKVTNGENKYTGNVIVPSTVTYNSVAYSVTGIGSYAFNYCTSLTSVTIGNGVKYIGDSAFASCENLTNVTIGNGVTSIGGWAFQKCTSLTSIEIPNSVIYIRSSAFYECTALTNVKIGNGVAEIDNSVFDDCDALKSIVVDEKNSVYDSREGCNAIIETATNTLVQGCKNTTIPNGVTSIGDYAFRGCDGLTSITIPNSVTSIGEDAFSGCDGLTNVTIGNCVTSIGQGAFEWCIGLANIVIDENNNVYDSREGCNAIIETATNTLILGCKNTAIPNSVTSIGESAFYYCDGLTSIEIPNGVTSIGYQAFYGCDGLTSVTIPNSVTSIGGWAFYGCKNLTAVHIGDLAAWCKIAFGSSMSDNPLYYAKNLYLKGELLTDIVIPTEITQINDYAFIGYSGKSVTIPNSITKIGVHAFAYSGLESISIPNSVIYIGDFALRECYSLKEVVIEDGTKRLGIGHNREDGIGNGFFRETGVERLYIGRDLYYPETGAVYGPFSSNSYWTTPEPVLKTTIIGPKVTDIPDRMFWECDNLTDIYFASNPTIGYSIPSAAICHLAITDSDAADFNTANANTYADVSYTCTISEGKYGTIMLPFAPDEASLENYAFYTLKEAGDGYIKFEEVAAPVANTPYLYTLRAGGENTAITGGETTIAADINNCNVDGWDLVGSFTNQTIDCTDGNYYAYSAARNEINRITKTLTVSPYRAYLKSTVAQNSNLRVFIGGTTGVTEISPDDIEGFDGGTIYDLYGRPVNEPAKGGVYIIDGKKVVW